MHSDPILNISIGCLPFSVDALELMEHLARAKAAEKALKEHVGELLSLVDEAAERGELDSFSYEPGVYEVPGVRLTQSTRTSFQYSPAIKALQKAEQENGLATPKKSTFWLVKLT